MHEPLRRPSPVSTHASNLSAVSRLFVVEEHPVIVSGLARLIAAQPDWLLLGGAASSDEALSMLASTSADLVILEPGIRGMEGLGRLAEIATRARVLCFSALREDLLAERVLREGARGYVMKTCPAEEIVSAIRTVLAGGIALSEAMRYRVVERFAGASAGTPADGFGVLNNRELQVIHLIGANRNSRQIAEHMHVSEKTVATHRQRIREKLRLRTPSELVRVAARWVEQDALS